MVGVKLSGNASYKVVKCNSGLSRFLVFRRSCSVQGKEESDAQNYYSNSSLSKNIGHDIFVSCSGMEKINSSISCRALNSCDFIVF